MLSSAKWRIELLGIWGFSAKAIQQTVQNYEGKTYSLSTIYRTLRKAGISIRSYRNGETKEAQDSIRGLMGTKTRRTRTRKSA